MTKIANHETGKVIESFIGILTVAVSPLSRAPQPATHQTFTDLWKFSCQPLGADTKALARSTTPHRIGSVVLGKYIETES